MPPRAARGRAWRRSSTALGAELELRADALDAAFPRGRPPLETVYLGGGTPSLLPADTIAALLAQGSRPLRARTTAPRSRSKPIRDPTSAAMPERSRRPAITRLSLGAQAMSAAGLRRLGRRHRVVDVVRAVAEARAAGIGSISLDLLYDVAGWHLGRLDRDARRGARARARPPVALRADARRSRRGGPDRPRRRPPADDGRRATLARRPRDRHRTRIAPRRSTTTPSIGWPTTAGTATRSATGPARDTRAVTTSSTGSAGRTRRSVPARTRSTGSPDAGTRHASTATSAALTPSDGSDPRFPPGESEPIDPVTAAAETVILGLRTDRGVPLAAAHEPPLADPFGWALAAELLDVTPDDRVVLTTRGRLLSNELFSRLV